jgi:hypothetical protein
MGILAAPRSAGTRAERWVCSGWAGGQQQTPRWPALREWSVPFEVMMVKGGVYSTSLYPTEGRPAGR